MKKKFIFIISLIACLSLALFAACTDGPTNNPPANEPIYWGTLVGTVTENGVGLEGVTVTSGTQTATTDKDGKYSIAVYDDGATVTFKKSGCITQSKTFKSSSFYTDKITYDFIMFISTKVYGTVTSANGVAVNGATVSIGIQQTQTDESGYFCFDEVIGTSMILTVYADGVTVKRPIYTEQMRSGDVEINIVTE